MFFNHKKVIADLDLLETLNQHEFGYEKQQDNMQGLIDSGRLGGIPGIFVPPGVPSAKDLPPGGIWVLAIYLPAMNGKSGVQCTLDLLNEVCQLTDRCDVKVSLIPGLTHRPGVRWEIVKPCANMGKAITTCRKHTTLEYRLSHADLLSMIFHFPDLIKNIPGNLDINLGGYIGLNPKGLDYHNSVYIGKDSKNRAVLHIGWEESQDPNRYCPVTALFL